MAPRYLSQKDSVFQRNREKIKKKRPLGFYIWFLAYILFTPVLKIFTHLKIENKENVFWLPGELPYIIIANHTSFLDPFVLGYAVFDTNKDLCPIRFMAKKNFSWFPLGEILTLLGAFFVDPQKPVSGTKKAFKILSDNQVIGIFPEGARSENDQLLPFQKGVSWLAEKTNSFLIPVVISGTFKKGKGFWGGVKKIFLFILGQYKIKVFFGPVIAPFEDIEGIYSDFYKEVMGDGKKKKK